jgi:hypothetical protein
MLVRPFLSSLSLTERAAHRSVRPRVLLPVLFQRSTTRRSPSSSSRFMDSLRRCQSSRRSSKTSELASQKASSRIWSKARLVSTTGLLSPMLILPFPLSLTAVSYSPSTQSTRRRRSRPSRPLLARQSMPIPLPKSSTQPRKFSDGSFPVYHSQTRSGSHRTSTRRGRVRESTSQGRRSTR